MIYKMKILFSILFILKTCSRSSATHSSSESESIRSSIAGIFQAVVTATTFSFFEPIRETSTTTGIELEIENQTYLYYSWERENYSFAILHIDFVRSAMNMTVQEYRIPKSGKIVNKRTKESYLIFDLDIGLENITIKTDKLFELNSHEKCAIEVSFDDLTTQETPSKPCELISYDHFRSEEDKRLAQQCKSAFLPMIRVKFLEHGKTLVDSLRLKTAQLFFSNRPNPLATYSISTFPYFCFNLRNITIRGLVNYQVLNKTAEPFVYTLWIKDILGIMILDYNSTVETPMQMNFVAEHISISIDLKKNLINVQAQNYWVVRAAEQALLTDHRSEIIMQHVESAIATTLMPSMKFGLIKNQTYKIYDMESPTGKMLDKIAQKSDWKTIKEMLSEWVPFNDEHISNQTEPYEYHVSFPNVTINLISRRPYPETIQCQFPNNLTMRHEMRVAPISKFRLSNKRGNGIDINFHANFTSISFSQITPNASSDSDSCEYYLHNNEDIKVEFSPIKNTSRDTDELKLKRKIDTALISMAKERITQNIKPLVCVPFRVCSQVVQTVDDFFQRFLDNVLEKCSLRKKTKSR
ncbi:uncharacterized protein LOC135837291 isoform X1 [Planococcus citri]|uniref:uncharacterized protein LOC135837291 isoform X1 n=1 Tax=Planococcus citri TaxID=170843 RepID=UPI0031F96194